MGDVLKSSVSIPDLWSLSQQWPPAVISHMGWRQQELEGMCAAAKQGFRQSRPRSCVYCGIWIKCDMYRHVASAKCRGAPCGRARSRTVWITFGGRMMFRGKLNQPALNTFFRRGQFDVRC